MRWRIRKSFKIFAPRSILNLISLSRGKPYLQMALLSNRVMANETRMVRMRLGGIVRMVLFGFLVPGAAAQMSPQSSPSRERATEQSPRSSRAKPQVELKRFSLLNGASIDVSPDWIELGQMPLPPSPRLARFAPQVTFLEFMALENSKTHSALRIATTTNPQGRMRQIGRAHV